jgi:DnaJ-class molecular chaperone
VDLYQELELNRNCTSEQIKNQYRILAQRHHPDKGGDVDKFQRIKQAYEVLIDPARRDEYDRTGSVTEPKVIHAEAVEHLSRVFHGVINNFDPESGNLVDLMRNEILALQMLIEQDKNTCKRHIEILEMMKDKIKIIDETKENILLSFASNQLELRYNELKVFDHRCNLVQVMLKLLENYHYGFFELPQH